VKTCPKCKKEYDYLGAHWYHNPEHRVEFSKKQKDVLKGLLMSDGSIDYSKGNARYHVKMTNKEYLEYIDNLLGVVSTGVNVCKTSKEAAQDKRESGFRPNAEAVNYSDVYQVRTIKHPVFNEFAKWYDSGKKVWPKKLELTPEVLKHLYVGDGTLQKSHNHISIAMFNERNNKEKIESYFTEKGLPKPNRWHTDEKRCHASWNVEESKKLLDYMGDAPPGFEYKWI
jgi:hypothetical protein